MGKSIGMNDKDKCIEKYWIKRIRYQWKIIKRGCMGSDMENLNGDDTKGLDIVYLASRIECGR